MRRFVTAVILIAAFSARGAEISSPYDPNFYQFPTWLPGSVSTNNTPGSPCTIQIIGETNHICTAWELAPDSRVEWWLGTEPYYGTTPKWSGSEWSPVEYIFDTHDHDYGSFILSVSGWREEEGAYDEWAEDLYYNLRGYIIDKETGETAAEDYCYAHFTRDVTTKIVATTNIVCSRITEPLQASFFHTIDGWCEREYFTGLGGNESDHDMKTTPLHTIGTNRTVETRRIVGKTNLWSVADRIVYTSNNRWRAGFTVQESCYTNTVAPYWSSQAFDDIYGEQLPSNIAWNRYGLESLSNKCAVLRGLKSCDVYGGIGTNGWLYTEMFPEDFIFGLTNTYDKPLVPCGHAFDFPSICATNLSPVIANEITNRTMRLELKTQAAVNQAEAAMDRTILPSGAISATNGNATRYIRVREFSSDYMTFDEAGLRPDNTCWIADSDIFFNLVESTNYWIITTNSWITDRRNSDALELSSNTVSVVECSFSSIGSWAIPANQIINYLNEHHIPGVQGITYYVMLDNVVRSGSEITVYLSSTIGCSLPDYHFPSVTSNSMIRASVRVANQYDVRSAGMPDFSSVDTMPMDQAWKPGSRGRVSTAKDICTAAVYKNDHFTIPDVNFHCAVHTFSRGNPVYNIHTNEWNIHRMMMMNQIQSARSYDWTNPRQYVEYDYMSVVGVLNSLHIMEGVYPFAWDREQWSVESLQLMVNDDGVWYLKSGSTSVLDFGPVFGGFNYALQRNAHTIPNRIPIEERCRTRITNFIDWNWNSIRRD